jgi:calcium-dependent protein kinase
VTPYTEDEAARTVSSILSAVGYMHSRKVVHRDLKYENIIFVNDSPMAEIKFIEFGLLSKKHASDKELTEGVGTVSELCVSEYPVVMAKMLTLLLDLYNGS